MRILTHLDTVEFVPGFSLSKLVKLDQSRSLDSSCLLFSPKYLQLKHLGHRLSYNCLVLQSGPYMNINRFTKFLSKRDLMPSCTAGSKKKEKETALCVSENTLDITSLNSY